MTDTTTATWVEACARDDIEPEDVIAAQGTVTQLRAEMASTQLPRPEETLTALAMAAGGR